MGARRRNVGPLLSPKKEAEASSLMASEVTTESLATEVGMSVSDENQAECSSSSGGSGNDDTDEEEVALLPDDREVTTSAKEDITEGELWFELEKELQGHGDESDVQAQGEEAAAVVIEITQEESMLADAVEGKAPNPSDNSESLHFYPPGRIMHIISLPPSNGDDSVHTEAGPAEERVAIYETPRNLYSKLRLSRTMIKDHFMPMYKKMMELLIRELENEEACTHVM